MVAPPKLQRLLESSRALRYGGIEHFLGTGLFCFQRENSGVRFCIHTVPLFFINFPTNCRQDLWDFKT